MSFRTFFETFSQYNMHQEPDGTWTVTKGKKKIGNFKTVKEAGLHMKSPAGKFSGPYYGDDYSGDKVYSKKPVSYQPK